jgi:hypothetical protein
MKIPLGRLRHAWEDVKIKWSVNVDWIQLAEDGLQCYGQCHEPLSSIKGGSGISRLSGRLLPFQQSI